MLIAVHETRNYRSRKVPKYLEKKRKLSDMGSSKTGSHKDLVPSTKHVIIFKKFYRICQYSLLYQFTLSKIIVALFSVIPTM